MVREGRDLLLNEAEHDPAIEIKVIDDTVCRKYSTHTEMTCYNHSSTMGTVLSHDYVTSLYVNNGLALPDGLKLIGTRKSAGRRESSSDQGAARMRDDG